MSNHPQKIWDHANAYDAMVNCGNKEVTTEHTRYVHLYPQHVNCAILYAPGSKFDNRPLHFHPGRSEWRPEVFRDLLPAIKEAHLEHKSKTQRDQNFIHCKVEDWGLFAEALRLR